MCVVLPKAERETMYRPSMYNKHDASMNHFAELFNALNVEAHIKMVPNEQETFDNDGVFIDSQRNICIGFDWEYRDKYFSNCRLVYPTLGQYERKLRKPSIQISIQCDSTETGVAVGWHADWLKEKQEHRALATDYAQKEQGATRYTHKFKIYSYEDMADFKRMVARTMESGVYSSEVF